MSQCDASYPLKSMNSQHSQTQRKVCRRPDGEKQATSRRRCCRYKTGQNLLEPTPINPSARFIVLVNVQSFLSLPDAHQPVATN